MPGDLREDLNAAMQSAEGGEGDTSGQQDDLVVDTDPITKEPLVKDSAGKPEGQDGTGDPAAADKPAGDRARGPDGKFAPKKGEQVPADQQPAAKDPLTAAPAGTPAAPAAQAIKPPASWTPEARETWGRMLPEHQLEVTRREREITAALQGSVEARRTAQELSDAVAPYAMLMQTEGVTPMQAIKSTLQTAALYRIGTPQQKAQATAALIKQFNVPIEMLDELLAGQVPSNPQGGGGGQATQQMIDQAVRAALQPIQQAWQTNQQRQDQELTQGALTELEEFASDQKNEFFMDVKEDMADLLALATRRGQILPLSEAYRRATLAHPSISKVLEGRTRAGAAAQQTAAAQRAKKASASVSSDSAPSRSDDAPEDDSVRSALVASMAESARRTA